MFVKVGIFYLSVITLTTVLFTGAAFADCWIAGPFSGNTASSNAGYSFVPDGFSKTTLMCFQGETGTVSGDDLQFVQFGSSTLVGVSTNSDGLATVEVYQVDRARQRALFSRSRIGTASVTSVLPDLTGAYVATVTPAP
jgi:hypothetical protein